MSGNSDKLSIKMRLGNTMRDFTIERDQEKFFREGANIINELYNRYSQHFQNQSDDKYFSTIALDLAIRYLHEKERNDSAPYTDVISKLLDEVEDALK